MEKNFKFDEKAHLYFLDDKPLTGITTILQVIGGNKTGALIQWAANEAVKYIQDKILTGEPILDNLSEWLIEAKTAHRRKKEEAGQKGTDVHAEIEILIKEALLTPTGLVGAYRGDNEQVKHFIKWATDNKVKFLESEKRLYSKKYWIAGTCDFICKIDGKVWLGDIKTGNAIYPEHFAQCAGYQLMIEENKLYEIAGHIIVNLRKDGTFEEKRSISLEDYKKFFLACLDIYRVQEKIKNQII